MRPTGDFPYRINRRSRKVCLSKRALPACLWARYPCKTTTDFPLTLSSYPVRKLVSDRLDLHGESQFRFELLPVELSAGHFIFARVRERGVLIQPTLPSKALVWSPRSGFFGNVVITAR